MFEKHDLHLVADGIKTNVRGQSFIDVEIVMKPPDERDLTAGDVIKLWRDEIGDIEGVDQITFDAERGPGGLAGRYQRGPQPHGHPGAGKSQSGLFSARRGV